MTAWLAILLLTSSAWAQEGPETKVIQSHAGGLATYNSENRLQDDQATIAQNVVFDKDKAVVKRNGYQLYGTVSSCSLPIRGGWDIKNTDGTEYSLIVCGSTVAVSNGDGVFDVIGGTISSSQQPRAAATLGELYITNGVDTVFSTDGVTVSSHSAVPLAKLVAGWKSRLVVANYPGSASTIFMSEYQNADNFTVPPDQIDTSPAAFYLNGPNDGRQVTCIYDGFRDVLIAWNEDQMYGIYGSGVGSFAIRLLSNQIGCTEQGSVQEHANKLRWMSKRGLEEWDGTRVNWISEPVQNLVDGIINTAATDLTITKQGGDLSAGNTCTSGNPNACLSTSISPGYVVPTTFSIVMNSDSLWSNGTKTRVEISNNRVYLSSVVVDSFTDGQYTSNPTWTDVSTGGSCDVSSGYLVPSGICGLRTPWAVYIGTWSFRYTLNTATVSNGYEDFFFLAPYYNSYTENEGYSITLLQNSAGTTHELSLDRHVNGTRTNLIGPVTLTKDNDTHTLKTTRDENGNFQLFYDSTLVGTVTDTVITSGTVIVLRPARAGVQWDDIAAPASSGTYVSAAFDTGFSTPTWGNISVTSTVFGSASIALKTRVASTCGGTYDADATETNDSKITSAAKRCIKFVADLSVTGGGAYIKTASLAAATTGIYLFDCFDLGTFSTWGLFQANTSVTTGGSIDFAISSGTTCGSVKVASATWTSQSNNTSITIDTAPFLGIRATFSMSTGVVQQPALYGAVVGYQTGTSRPSLVSTVYKNRYMIFFTTDTSATAYNDTTLVYDYLGRWSQFKGINASSAWVNSRHLYTGSSASDGKVFLQDTGSSDNGSNIEFIFKTPSLDLGYPGYKYLQYFKTDILPVTDPVTTSTMTLTYFVDRSTIPYSLGSVYLGSDNSMLSPKAYFQRGADPTTARDVSVQFYDNSSAAIRIYRSRFGFSRRRD